MFELYNASGYILLCCNSNAKGEIYGLGDRDRINSLHYVLSSSEGFRNPQVEQFFTETNHYFSVCKTMMII
jgi:hypothetical protein